MKKKTLLEMANDIRNSKSLGIKKVTEEHIDLAFAWLKDEVRLIDIAKVLHFNTEKNNVNSNVYLFLIRTLREAYRRGKIDLHDLENE